MRMALRVLYNKKWHCEYVFICNVIDLEWIKNVDSVANILLKKDFHLMFCRESAIFAIEWTGWWFLIPTGLS